MKTLVSAYLCSASASILSVALPSAHFRPRPPFVRCRALPTSAEALLASDKEGGGRRLACFSKVGRGAGTPCLLQQPAAASDGPADGGCGDREVGGGRGRESVPEWPVPKAGSSVVGVLREAFTLSIHSAQARAREEAKSNVRTL